jgi:hypothetical protein
MRLQKLTDQQLLTLFERLLDRIYRAFDGGTQYGVDLPTLALCEPRLYRAYLRIRTEGRNRRKAS